MTVWRDAPTLPWRLLEAQTLNPHQEFTIAPFALFLLLLPLNFCATSHVEVEACRHLAPMPSSSPTR